MSRFLTSVLAVGVILGFMILIHEFGHYAVAKLLGVRVEQFAIGFGKRLIGFRKGETDYRINAHAAGRLRQDERREPDGQRTGDPGEFMSHPRWHRFLIAIAGPAMNILLAVGLLTVRLHGALRVSGFTRSACDHRMGDADTPAAKAGIQPGDRISASTASRIRPGNRLIREEALSPNQPLDVTIQRGGEVPEQDDHARSLRFRPDGLRRLGPERAEFSDHRPGPGHARRKGRDEGRRDYHCGRQAASGLAAMIESLKRPRTSRSRSRSSATASCLLSRCSRCLSMTMDRGDQRYRIGIGSAPMKIGRLSFAAAFRARSKQNKQGSLLILELVQKDGARKISIRSIEGPIGIGRAAGQAASEKGWTPALGTDRRESA